MPQLPFKDKGPVQLTWDYGDSNLVINPVLGTVSLTTVDSVSDVQEERYGETPVDAVFTGTVVELAVPMTRSTLTQLISLLEGVESGGADVAIFKVKSGCDMYSSSKQILIQPLCDNVPDADLTHAILLYKCFPYRDFDLGFNREDQRVHMVRFKVFPNQESGYEGKYYQYGVSS